MLPFRIEARAITADSLYRGDDLVLVTALPARGNPARAVIITTGQDVRTISEVQGTVPADLAIMRPRAWMVLREYRKDGGGWTFGNGLPTWKVPASER